MNEIIPVRIRLIPFSLYVFCLFICFLASSYIGGFMRYLYFFLLLLPIISFLYLFYEIYALRFHQHFSTEHPYKGETVSYTLKIANESFLPITNIYLSFVDINPYFRSNQSDAVMYLWGKKSHEITIDTKCLYRGIYTMGLKNIFLQDFCGFIKFRIPVWHRTFYVYPRVLELEYLGLGLNSRTDYSDNAAEVGFLDYTLFRQINEYKDGTSIRHMYWKKYASLGIPFVKEYDFSTEPGILIYLDLGTDINIQDQMLKLEQEDISIEILVCLVNYFLKLNIPVTVHASGKKLYTFEGNHPEHFKKFFNSTLDLIYHNESYPGRLARADNDSGLFDSRSIIYITHRMDCDIFDFLEDSIHFQRQRALILNYVGTDEGTREKRKNYFKHLRERGFRIFEIHSGNTVIEELEYENIEKIIK